MDEKKNQTINKSSTLLPVVSWLFALLPLSLLVLSAVGIAPVVAGQSLYFSLPWVSALDLELSFAVDGLSLLFSLLVSGIGLVVMIYARSYLAGNPQLLRFHIILSLFMVAMMGLVLADNLLLLFIFWELTSITSYLLIGFKHEYQASRSAALLALLVTGAGGLSLLAGLTLLGITTGEWQISTLLLLTEEVQSSALFSPALILILIGAFTKSAQFPFHFWLPGAMEAPAPVSAYLHSATMVKAGIYLLARFSPIFAETMLWQSTLIPVGIATMLLGAILAIQKTDLKRILAYSTISVLGILVMLLGIATALAIKGMLILLVAHALYKGALFMIAGGVEHTTGIRDITQLSGLRSLFPMFAVTAGLAALSKAGFIPMLGFISKEVLYEATLDASFLTISLTSVALVTNILLVGTAGLVAIKPFFGPVSKPSNLHKASLGLWFGPLVLAFLNLPLGLFPDWIGSTLITPATSAVLGKFYEAKVVLWKGINIMLILSIITVLAGIVMYIFHQQVRKAFKIFDWGARIGPGRIFQGSLTAMQWLANTQTRVLQNGYLPNYLLVIITTAIILVGFPILNTDLNIQPFNWSDIRVYEAVIALLIPVAALASVRARSRLSAIASLGVVGFSVAMIFMLFGAPDLAMTQFAVEILIVILFVLVIYRLPRFKSLTSRAAKWRDALVAVLAGGLVTTLVIMVTSNPLTSRLSPYFVENSLPLARGRNIVNTILVDFRSLDTLGEIVVLAAAAIGIYALMRWLPETNTGKSDIANE